MRGLILTDDFWNVENNRTRVSSGLSPERIKNVLLFWDQICHVSAPQIVLGPEENFYQELKTLQDEKILSSILIVPNNELDDYKSKGVNVSPFINPENLKVFSYDPILVNEEIEGVGMLKQGNVLEFGNGLRIGASGMRVKELYNNTLVSQARIVNLFNQQRNGYWSLGQAKTDFEMPIFDGVCNETQLMELTLRNLLPFPDKSTHVDVILGFKEKYSSELLRFQLVMSKLTSKIEDAGGDCRVMQDYKDEIEISLRDLHRTLDESRIKKVIGVVKSLLDIKQIGSAPVVASSMAYLMDVHMVIGAISGYGLSGAMTLMGKKEKKIEKLDQRVKDFAYLYYAGQRFQ